MYCFAILDYTFGTDQIKTLFGKICDPLLLSESY